MEKWLSEELGSWKVEESQNEVKFSHSRKWTPVTMDDVLRMGEFSIRGVFQEEASVIFCLASTKEKRYRLLKLTPYEHEQDHWTEFQTMDVTLSDFLHILKVFCKPNREE